MLVVVEGISACGKTTWCGKQDPSLVVPETGRVENAPDRERDPEGAARFWVEQNAKRWAQALAIESEKGIAICDTDPLKLHYIWCLWQIGLAPEEQWVSEREEARAAIAARRLGFADEYYVKRIDPEEARKQKEGDATRRRGNFAVHVRLQEPLLRWYEAMGRVWPGRVHWDFPEGEGRLWPSEKAGAERYRSERFAEFLEELR